MPLRRVCRGTETFAFRDTSGSDPVMAAADASDAPARACTELAAVGADVRGRVRAQDENVHSKKQTRASSSGWSAAPQRSDAVPISRPWARTVPAGVDWTPLRP